MPFESFYRKLPCGLSDDELRARGDRLASLARERAQIEEEKKTVLAEFRAKLKRVGQETVELAEQIASKLEHRQVECYEEPQPGKLIMAIIRKDTAEVVETRPMRDEERQEKLKLIDLPERRSRRGRAAAAETSTEDSSDG